MISSNDLPSCGVSSVNELESQPVADGIYFCLLPPIVGTGKREYAPATYTNCMCVRVNTDASGAPFQLSGEGAQCSRHTEPGPFLALRHLGAYFGNP